MPLNLFHSKLCGLFQASFVLGNFVVPLWHFSMLLSLSIKALTFPFKDLMQLSCSQAMTMISRCLGIWLSVLSLSL